MFSNSPSVCIVFTNKLAMLCAGPTTCRNCGHKIGLEIEYKQGRRQYGYTLGKDNVMWRHDGDSEYRAIKKWSAVPFQVEEEKLFPGADW